MCEKKNPLDRPLNSLRGQFDVFVFLSGILSHSRLRCTPRSCVWVCLCVCRQAGGCCGSVWHRWHGAAAVPWASVRHVAHSQPHTTYAKGGERERGGGISVFLTTTWVHRSPVLHHMLSACLSTSLSVCLPALLPTKQSTVNGQTVSAKIMSA